MQHLTTEEIARLVDEAPTPAEAGHLQQCARCAEELRCLREQTKLLSMLDEQTAPERHWPRLRAELISEGLLIPTRQRGTGRYRQLVRVAAALALFVAGGASGAVLRGAQPPASPGPMAASGTTAALTSIGNAATPDEATDQLASAEQLYLAALTRYAELTQTDDPVDPITRLAALEGIVLTAQAALRESPADPVINGYLLTAVGQREAMLRQISNTGDETWF